MKHGYVTQRVLVTGGSGELGGALARYHARPGTQLSLWGRSHARLAVVADSCRASGAVVDVRSQDISDLSAALRALIEEDESDPFDLAIFASGSGDIRAAGDRVEDPALVERLALVNFTAPAAMAAALAGRMAARGHGHIVLIGSAAAFHALPFAAAYSGAKAGLTRFADALRIGVRGQGVRVTLVSPGFIDTAAGRKVPGPRPFAMSPDHVARKIVRAIRRGRAHLVLPWYFALLRGFDRLLPRWVRDRLLLAMTPPGHATPPSA